MYGEPGYPEPNPNGSHSAIRRQVLQGAGLLFGTDIALRRTPPSAAGR